MIARHAPGGEDPRRALTSAELQAASDRARPRVARKGGSDALGLGAGLLGACLLGAFTLVSLSQGRAQASGAAAAAQASFTRRMK
ncbi:hypothetical protein H8B08_18680, partial [Caulobacter sp. 17J80-11]|nr:hypothetical protein [Caulobacter sp. 17J80-11]